MGDLKEHAFIRGNYLITLFSGFVDVVFARDRIRIIKGKFGDRES